MILSITNKNLLQVKSLLSQLSDRQLSQPLKVLNGSSIGMHIRHVIEFFICLLDAVQNNKVVNYDARLRNQRLESDVDYCIVSIHKVITNIDGLTQDIQLSLCADYSLNEENEILSLPTTLYRELLYNIEHTVHHLAIIKIGVKAMEAAIHLDPDFGVAASTIRYQNSCAQ